MTGGYFANNSDPLTIGTDDNGINSFDGNMDDIRIGLSVVACFECISPDIFLPVFEPR